MSEKTAIEVLRDIEWIRVYDGVGVPYTTCPACFAEKDARGTHTAWCPLAKVLQPAAEGKDPQ